MCDWFGYNELTILWSDQYKLRAEGPSPSRRDCSNDTDEGGVWSECANGECGGVGGELEAASWSNNSHVDDVLDNDTIYVACLWWIPCNGGRAGSSGLSREVGRRCTGSCVSWKKDSGWTSLASSLKKALPTRPLEGNKSIPTTYISSALHKT